MKKSYIACALAAAACSVSMASTPVASVGSITTQAPPPITTWAGKCSNWFTCGINQAGCFVANGKYKEFDWVDVRGNKQHSFICVT